MRHIFKIAGALTMVVLIAAAPPVSGQAQAPAGTPNPDGPRIKFSETAFDFGKIKSSEPVRHEFIVTNVGNATLDIVAVQPGCPGCTTALPWDRQIEPGKTGKIPIQFNPHGFSGMVSKSVTVSSTDPTQASQMLTFRANVWQPIEVQPAYVYFMPAEGEETNETKIVRIVSNLEEPLTLAPPECSNPGLKLELKTVQPGKEFALHITHAGPTSNAVPQGLITIGTSSTNVPIIKVTTHIMPQPALVISPLQITLPASLAAGHRHTQMIRNNSSTLMKVTEASVNADGVTVQINESQPGKLFLLMVNFPANFQSHASQPLELTVKTTHPKRPVIKVPVVEATTLTPAGLRRPPTQPVVTK
jgi:hypothetical protein